VWTPPVANGQKTKTGGGCGDRRGRIEGR
jgi:hypothetical protein